MKITNDIQFLPDVADFEAMRANHGLTVICGLNNSGKSLLLKKLKAKKGKLAYLMGMSRFSHAFYISPRQISANELDEYEKNFRNHYENIQQNSEANFIDLQRIITALKDKQRDRLFELCSSLLGHKLTLKREEDDNVLSFWYIDIDGYNVSVGSTGTRLLLTILGMCLDTRFSSILIDEPELGLGPQIQNSLATFLQNDSERQRYFPHLKQIFLATHSHLFLNRNNLHDNFRIYRHENAVSLEQITTVQDFHRLQFNLIGNTLETMFLPSAIIIVEGKTDFQFLDRVIRARFPSRKITLVDSGGDPKKKVHSVREVFGNLSGSPFQSRLFVVLDSVHNPGLSQELVNMGVMETNIIKWSKNGIEYLYPSAIMRQIFSCSDDQLNTLNIDGDIVRINGVEKKKNELCDEIVQKLSDSTQFPSELTDRFLYKLDQVVL